MKRAKGGKFSSKQADLSQKNESQKFFRNKNLYNQTIACRLSWRFWEKNTYAWEKRKLGEVATFINGRAYKQEELLDRGKYKVVRVGNFNTNEHWYYSDLELEEEKYMESGDLVYLWATDFGPRFWEEDKAIYHYHIWKLKLNNDVVDKNYLYSWLETDKERIKQSTNGTTMVHVTKSTIENREFYFPTLSEQVKIGQLFRKVDKLIEVNKRLTEQYQLLKKALLQQMFV